MKSGAIFGTAASIDGMIDRIEEELGSPATVIATGGLARRILPFCRRDILFDENLLLRGLWVIWQKNIIK
jgi:type III pantothenate kinase